MVIILYMMEVSPPCRAVLMTIKHIGVQYELREQNTVIGNYNRNQNEFFKINPRLCVPTIDDGGFYLWESRAIMTYLVNKYNPCDPIYPKDAKKRAVVDMMLSFDQGTLYKSLVEYLYPLIFRGESADDSKEFNYQMSLSILEEALSHAHYVAGDHVTLADLSIMASITTAEVYNYNFKPYPNIAKWLNRLKNELPYHRDVNEIPLMQFKLWYRPLLHSETEEEAFDFDTTRL